MRYFLPDICLASASTMNTPFMERLGGVPSGLPLHLWPICSECGQHQSLLAQFAHHPERLDLGREGRMLFIFQCSRDPGMCGGEPWAGQSGANACFVVETERLLAARPNPPPTDPQIEREAYVVNWIARDDGISESLRSVFFDDAQYLRIDEDVLKLVPQVTRLGSVPAWIQSAGEGPKGNWRFVGQLDSWTATTVFIQRQLSAMQLQILIRTSKPGAYAFAKALTLVTAGWVTFSSVLMV